MPIVSNKSLFQIHRWIGLNCGVILFVICISGTVATLSEEIDWLINPALRVSPAGTPLSWAQLEERVESQHPDVSVRAIHAPRNSRTAAFVEVLSDTGRPATLLVNPFSGEVQGVYSYHCVKVLFRVFHKQFYIFGFPKGIHGTYLVGAYGLALLIAGVTGLLFYKRFLARMFVLRWNRGRDIFWRDSHRLLGVWTSLLLLVWSITGVWYLAEKILGDTSLISTSPNLPIGWNQDGPTGNLPASQRTASELGTGDYLRIAKREFPELRVTAIYLPRTAGGAAIVVGTTDAMLVRADSSQLLIDSFTGEVLARRKAEDLDAFHRWAATADPLHFGTFGGLGTKILWCLFGLGVSALIPIGATIWYRRTSRHAEDPGAKSTGARRSPRAKFISIAWNGFILAAAVGYTYAMSPPRVDGPELVSVADLRTVEIGPWTVELARLGSAASGQQATFRLRFPESKLPNIKRAMLQVGEKEVEFSGTWDFYHCRLLVPAETDFDHPLILKIEAQDGAVHQHKLSHQAWTTKGKQKIASIPPEVASPWVTGIFLSLFAVVGIFTSVWFWKIG